MTGYLWQILHLFLILYMYTTAAVSDGINTMDRRYVIVLSENCSLDFKQDDVTRYTTKAIGSRNKLVYVRFRFTHTVTLPQEPHGDLLEPLTWIRVSGHHGNKFLNLLHQYEALSLQTLGIGVEHTTIDVTESRTGCLTNRPMSVLGQVFRDSILDNFNQSVPVDGLSASEETLEESSEPPQRVDVCYMIIGREVNIAKFTYMCCHRNQHGEIVCRELTTDKWMKLVLLFIHVINVFVLAFCPFLIPESFYIDTKGDIPYRHNFISKRKRIKMIKTSVEKPSVLRFNIMTKRFVDKCMPKLSKVGRKMKLDEPYECEIGAVDFIVKSRDLVSDSDVPVGIFSTIYNGLVRCDIRHYHPVLDCCNGNVLGELNPFSCNLLWYECLTYLMTAVVIVLLAVPWITRVLFYTLFEKDHFEKRQIAAASRNLRAPYEGNFTLYLSPTHVTFLICYFVTIIESICFGMLQTNEAKSFRSVIRQCFQDMHNTSRNKFSDAFFRLLLKPCYKFGIFGLIMFPFFGALILPFLLARVVFYFVPMFNLTIRLLGSLIKYLCPSNSVLHKNKSHNRADWERSDSETTSIHGEGKRGRSNFFCLTKFRRLVMTIVYLLGLYSFLFLLVEFVQFVVIIAIYTFIGIVLNSSHSMQYVPLLFMIAVYGRTTFGDVYKKYRVFNKFVQKHVLEIFNDMSSTGRSDLVNVNSNTAFEFPPETDDNLKFTVYQSNLTWRSRHVVLFVDKHGTPYIPKQFFYQCCEMDHYAAPGTLLPNLTKAICRFLLIIAFLLFVGLVVKAFREELKISLTNQTFITIVGSLIPFVLSNFLFKVVELPKVEKKDIRFRKCLNKLISEYRETFSVSDIECKSIDSIDSQKDTGNTGSDDSQKDTGNTGSDDSQQVTGGTGSDDSQQVTAGTGSTDSQQDKGNTGSDDSQKAMGNTGSGDHMVMTIDLPSKKTGSCPSHDFSNIKFADDLDDSRRVDKGQITNESKTQRYNDELRITKIMKNGIEEITSNQPLDSYEMPVWEDAKQSKPDDSSEVVDMLEEMDNGLQLQNYDIVIHVLKERTVKEYFRSLITHK